MERDIYELVDGTQSVITTTSQRNGYPADLKKAVIGFVSFEEAERFAERNGMVLQIFTKRDGWNLWYRTNDNAIAPFDLIEIKGRNENNLIFTEKDRQNFFDDFVKDRMNEVTSVPMLKELADNARELDSRIEDLCTGEFVVARNYKGFPHYYDTYDKTTLDYTEDVTRYVIGAIFKG